MYTHAHPGDILEIKDKFQMFMHYFKNETGTNVFIHDIGNTIPMEWY